MHREASTVIVVPGGPGLPYSFYKELVSDISAFSRPVTYARHGLFPHNDGDFPRSFGEAADELADAVTEVGGRAVFLGHSFGAAVALEALCRGVEVAGAVLISGFFSGQMVRRGVLARIEAFPHEFHERYNGRDGRDPETIAELLATHWFPRHFCRAEWPDSFSEGLETLNRSYLEHFLGANIFDLSGVAMTWDRSVDLGRIDVPTLLVTGRNDYFRQEDVEAMHHAIRGSTLWISEPSSHSPWIEDREPTIDVIRSFVERLTPDGR